MYRDQVYRLKVESDPQPSADRVGLGQGSDRQVQGSQISLARQVRARPCPGRGHGQGVVALSPHRVAEPAASLQNTTQLRPPVLDPPLRPPAGSQVLPRVVSQALRRGSCGGRKHKFEAPPVGLREPIGARSLGARVLTHSSFGPSYPPWILARFDHASPKAWV